METNMDYRDDAACSRRFDQLVCWTGVLSIAACMTVSAIGEPAVVYFSTEQSFTAAAGPHAGQLISHGDLLSTAGVVIARNGDLIRNFGPMPVVPDFGLDGIYLRASGEMLFSLEDGFFDEVLATQVRHGDLLSDSGAILQTNAQLLRNYGPMPAPDPDYGLDAIHEPDPQQIWFSVEDGFFDESQNMQVGHGDLLSDAGNIVKTNAELVLNFSPMPVPDPDYGLDAVHPISGAEIWFSVEGGFFDEVLGIPVGAGDLLSTDGRIVQRNAELLAGFFGGAVQVPADYGLDAVWVIPEPLSLVVMATLLPALWKQKMRPLVE